ncbi:hypothetical protein M404DRAFT_1006478 [Pisolithus tinctorius Marx 270]|uniref:Uncharacterized protein n=1 Tax=Pisolithus tinctorius Marx 270 TaxID=870435 RepID=A0A0C3NMQ3_PISTI|nr:hypothetical protein M404DRAFT_1006478 [Pisolithus tinctorius Marx 270]
MYQGTSRWVDTAIGLGCLAVLQSGVVQLFPGLDVGYLDSQRGSTSMCGVGQECQVQDSLCIT